MASILVVEADAAVRSAVAAELRGFGHEVLESGSAAEALRILPQHRPDLVLLDRALPDMPGSDVLRHIKQSDSAGTIRVLMTSASGRAGDIAESLDAGADDCIAKPLSMIELGARLRASLRRPAITPAGDRLCAGGITLDSVAHRVFVDGDSLSLAPREFRLLEFLMSNRDRVFSRAELLVHVWDRSTGLGVRTVDVHVRRLRSLLEPYRYDSYLQTVRGSGYRFSRKT